MPASRPAIDCKFGKAKVGDLLPLPSPFKLGETVGKLVRIEVPENQRSRIHVYELFYLGAKFATVQAKETNAGIEWKTIQ